MGPYCYSFCGVRVSLHILKSKVRSTVDPFVLTLSLVKITIYILPRTVENKPQFLFKNVSMR